MRYTAKNEAGIKTKPRTSNNEYKFGVVATYPDGQVVLVSCHYRERQAMAQIGLARAGKGGTAARWKAINAGATFNLSPLDVLSDDDSSLGCDFAH
jgi:hypothetical protein